MNTLNRLQNKLDAEAIDQLRDVAAHLYEELEKTKCELQKAHDALQRAEEIAEFWREQATSVDAQLAITKTGDIVVIN
jgi:hypothetical protein